MTINELEIHAMVCPLAVLVQQAIAELQGSYQHQQVLVAGAPDVLVLVDKGRAVQIIVNLRDNAATYSPDGSQVWIAGGDRVAVRVRDAGSGVPAEGRDRLFSRFGRLRGSKTRAGRAGTGLGLYLSRRLAEALKGSLDLEASGPKGSIFRLRLPLASAPVLG